MKKIGLFLLFALMVQPLATIASVQTPTLQFITGQDLNSNDSASNIYLKNGGGGATTVYGLYVRQLAYVTPGDNCDQATPIYLSDSNVTVGAVLMPIVINAGKSVSVGKNYLYNMLFQADYYLSIIFPSSPPGCALPGCTWGSDTTIYNWCIYLGALAPAATSTNYTANVPPSTTEASSPGQYNYNLITNYVVLGPISCNDQTLTCTVATQQTQTFS